MPLPSPTTTIPANRVIRFNISTGAPELTDASSNDAIGFTKVQILTSHAPSNGGNFVFLGRGCPVWLMAAGTVTRGPVFLAADGKVASSGTVKIGVAYSEGTDAVVAVVPCW